VSRFKSSNRNVISFASLITGRLREKRTARLTASSTVPPYDTSFDLASLGWVFHAPK